MHEALQQRGQRHVSEALIKRFKTAVSVQEYDMGNNEELTRTPFSNDSVGIDFSEAVQGRCILLINDSTIAIQFRVHDSPNNLHVISESRGTTQGQSYSTAGREAGSTHVSAGPSMVSVRADASWQRSQQDSHNQSLSMHTTYKERKQLPAQMFMVLAGRRLLVNLSDYTVDVCVDAWFRKQAKPGMQQQPTMNLMQNRVVKAGQALRIGRDAPALCAWCEEATGTPAGPVPSSTEAGSNSRGAGGANDTTVSSTQVKGGTPDMGFQC
eukprot:gene13564-13690_t